MQIRYYFTKIDQNFLYLVCIHLLFQMSPFDTGLVFKDSENRIALCSRQFQKY